MILYQQIIARFGLKLTNLAPNREIYGRFEENLGQFGAN